MSNKIKFFLCQICDEVKEHKVLYAVNCYPIYKCKCCGVGRAEVLNFKTEKIYNNGYFTGVHEDAYADYVGSKNVISREFSKTLDFIKSHGPSKGKLIEVGCAYGFFLQQAKSSFNVFGVEVVKEAAAHCLDSGLQNVKCGQIDEDYMNYVGAVDVAVMLDVIEHIDNVSDVIGLISKHLEIGGTLTVTTGDWASIFARITGSRWRLMAPPFHLWYFTPLSMKILGQRFGLEIVSIRYPWKVVPFELVLRQAMKMIGVSLNVSLPNCIRFLGIPSNLFDSMRVVFKKII